MNEEKKKALKLEEIYCMNITNKKEEEGNNKQNDKKVKEK